MLLVYLFLSMPMIKRENRKGVTRCRSVNVFMGMNWNFCPVGENVKWYSCYENSVVAPQNVPAEKPYDPEIPLQGSVPKNRKQRLEKVITRLCSQTRDTQELSAGSTVVSAGSGQRHRFCAAGGHPPCHHSQQQVQSGRSALPALVSASIPRHTCGFLWPLWSSYPSQALPPQAGPQGSHSASSPPQGWGM